MTDERLTLRQAAARLGVSESAIRKRVERGTLRSDKGPDGRRYVYLDTGADNVADEGVDTSATGERDALISEMVEGMRAEVYYLRDQLHHELERRSAEAERYQQIVAALTTANASLSERLRELEPPQGTPPASRESPDTAEETSENAEHRPDAGGAQIVAERLRQHNGWRAPLAKLPWWHYVLGLVLVGVVAWVFPWFFFEDLLRAGVIASSVFGLWVGLRRSHLRFRTQVIPLGALVGLVIVLGNRATYPALDWVHIYETKPAVFFVSYLLGYMSSTFFAGWLLFVSGALIGSAWQRRRAERLSRSTPAAPLSGANLASPASRTAGWTPRQQALLGFAGTIIAALISFMGTILSVIMASGG